MGGTKVGDCMASIYLDNAASTKVNERCLRKFNEIAETLYGNPSSKHNEGLLADECIQYVKNSIASRLNCDSDDIYFSMGATMSNQLCVQGFLSKHPDGMIITTNVEHNDMMLLMDNLLCFKHILKVGSDGLINITSLRAVLDYATKDMNTPVLVAIQMANSETGIIQPIKEIGELLYHYENVYFYVDATQYIPYYPVDMNDWHIDGLGMSGQKIGGIKGSGLFVARQRLKDTINPIIYGEQGLIGGTLSTPLIASLGEAFNQIDYNVSTMKTNRDILLSHLQKLGGVLVGTLENRLPNNIYIRFPSISGLTLMNILSLKGISIGTGSACSTDSDIPSHVALAYGLSAEEALECVRFTLSNETTYDEIEYVVNVIDSILPLLL